MGGRGNTKTVLMICRLLFMIYYLSHTTRDQKTNKVTLYFITNPIFCVCCKAIMFLCIVFKDTLLLQFSNLQLQAVEKLKTLTVTKIG